MHCKIFVPFISAFSHLSLPKFPLTSFTIVPSTFLFPSCSYLRNNKSKQFQNKKDNINHDKLCLLLHRTEWDVPPASSDKKRKKTTHRFSPTFMLHLTVWGVSPASSDKTTNKYKWLDLLLCYIWLYEVCHPPVQIKRKKKVQMVRPTFMLHLTVWGVPPASSDKTTNKYK